MGNRLLAVALAVLAVGCGLQASPPASPPASDTGTGTGTAQITLAYSRMSDLAYAPAGTAVGVVTIKSVDQPTYLPDQKRVETLVHVETVDGWKGRIPSTLRVIGIPNMAPGSRFFVRVGLMQSYLVLALPVADDGTITLTPDHVPTLDSHVPTVDDVDGGSRRTVSLSALKRHLR
jgi:hypothetical protein